MSRVNHVWSRETGSRRIMLALPTYSGHVPAQVACSLWSAAEALVDAGISSELYVESENCHVDDTRNGAVRAFLASGCADLVFLDFDVVWSAADLIRLVSVPGDVVAGVYPKKTDDTEFPVEWDASKKQIWAAADGLIEVWGAPTGFMRISRQVLEALVKTHADRGFAGQHATGGESLYYPIFERGIFNGKRRSGDYAFCHKARDAGFTIRIDPNMRFGHIGQKTWEGCLGDHMRRQAGLDSPSFAKAMGQLQGGEATHEVFCALYKGWDNPWAAYPDFLMASYRIARNTDGSILETGSGLSTLVLGAAADLSGARITALEHDAQHYQRTRDALKRYGITSVDLFYAPLQERAEGWWYGVPADMTPEYFAAVVCDGPPCHFARDLVVAVLREQTAHADWLIDDADRGQVQRLIEACAPGREVHVLGSDGAKRFALIRKAKQQVAA